MVSGISWMHSNIIWNIFTLDFHLTNVIHREQPIYIYIHIYIHIYVCSIIHYGNINKESIYLS